MNGPRDLRSFAVAAAGALALAAGLALTAPAGLRAQGIPFSGQDIAPVYEGWRNNPDGTIELIFGYFNRNQEQELDIPVGPDNNLEPSGPDQGQPTHFYPRRNRFVFRVRVPKDFGKKELLWTLVANGKKNTAYATLHPDYYTDDFVVIQNQGGQIRNGYNGEIGQPPALKVEGDRARTAAVGQPVSLAAVATEGRPSRRSSIPLIVPWTEKGDAKARIGARCCASAANGLRLSWFVYRGPAAHVTFDPPQFSQWEDYRDARNSPYSAGWQTPPIPAANRWLVRATFKQPGTYVLRALAHDGGLMTSEDVTVVVK